MKQSNETSIPTPDGPVTVVDGVVTVPEALKVRRPPPSAPLEHARRRSSTEGAPVLEHASWCQPTVGHDEIRTEKYRTRNDAGVPFETTRCIECGAQVVVNLADGTINAEAGDSSLVPLSIRQAGLDEGLTVDG